MPQAELLRTTALSAASSTAAALRARAATAIKESEQYIGSIPTKIETETARAEPVGATLLMQQGAELVRSAEQAAERVRVAEQVRFSPHLTQVFQPVRISVHLKNAVTASQPRM